MTAARIDLPHLDLRLVVPRREVWTARVWQQMADLVEQTLSAEEMKPAHGAAIVISYAVLSAEHDCFLAEVKNGLRQRLPGVTFLDHLPADRVIAAGALWQARILSGQANDSERVL